LATLESGRLLPSGVVMRSAAKAAGSRWRSAGPRMSSGTRRVDSITVPATLAFEQAQGVLHVLHVEAVASGGQAVHLDAQVLHAVVLDRVDVLAPGTAFTTASICRPAG
jgi:hypothetical protein